MDYKTVNKKRYSVRDFLDRNIDNETLTQITKEAQHSPSWANAQPWKVYFAKGETLTKIKQEAFTPCTAMIGEIMRAIIWLIEIMILVVF